MTYSVVKEFVKEFLRGDNHKAEVTYVHFQMAIMEISTLCTPLTLVKAFDGTQIDVFRMLPNNGYGEEDVASYIPNPTIPNPLVLEDEVPIDSQLMMAIIFFICSYLSNKYTDRFEAKAKRTISVYTSNIVET